MKCCSLQSRNVGAVVEYNTYPQYLGQNVDVVQRLSFVDLDHPVYDWYITALYIVDHDLPSSDGLFPQVQKQDVPTVKRRLHAPT